MSGMIEQFGNVTNEKNDHIKKLIKEKEELEQRIDKAAKMVHNIRRYSEVYTPIKEGCEEVLRVLKGRK